MAILQPTDLGGRVVWLGLVADRAATLRSGPVAEATLRFEGIVGESHSGLVRAACSRVTVAVSERDADPEYPAGLDRLGRGDGGDRCGDGSSGGAAGMARR